MANGIVRLDNVKSVYVGHVYSVVDVNADVENGTFGSIGDLIAGERELRTLGLPVAGKPVVVVATAEIIYQTFRRIDQALGKFINLKGEPCTAYELNVDDVLSVTKVTGTPVVGSLVVIDPTTRIAKVVTSVTTEAFVCKIEALEVMGFVRASINSGIVNPSYTHIVLRVLKNATV